jgi:endonuclease III
MIKEWNTRPREEQLEAALREAEASFRRIKVSIHNLEHTAVVTALISAQEADKTVELITKALENRNEQA